MIRSLQSTVGGTWRTRLPDRKLAGLLIVVAGIFSVANLQAFEGRIHATLTRSGEVQTWLYTIDTNCVRIERGETNWPYAKNLFARDTGDVTLLFPHNRSFVRVKPVAEKAPAPPPMMPTMPAPPPGIGPQTLIPPSVPPPAPPSPIGVGLTNLPGLSPHPAIPQMPSMPAAGGMMPVMPMMPMTGEALELKATGETTNLLGYTCVRYEIKQRGEVMEVWATDQLLPFQSWLPNQPPRFGPQMIEEKWGELVHAKKLFPLLAILRFQAPTAPDGTAPAAPGSERLRFEVKAITAEKVEDKDGALFQPPADYQEIEPLPF